MLAPFLIMLREGMEAALIVGIIATYLRRTGRAAWLPAVWAGVLFAAAAALFAGAVLQAAHAEFPQKAQEMFEAVVGFAAVAILVSMVFWMRRAARALAGDLRRSVDAALSGGTGGGWALIGMVFFAVAREGLESVFFLLAIFQQSPGPQAPVGAFAGLLVSAALGYGFYAGGVRLDLGRFFRFTGGFVLIVAAGVLAGAIRNLHEAGVWNALQTPVFDLGGVLPVSSVLGTVLSGLFGYQEAPRTGELIAYAAFLAVSLSLFLRPATRTEVSR